MNFEVDLNASVLYQSMKNSVENKLETEHIDDKRPEIHHSAKRLYNTISNNENLKLLFYNLTAEEIIQFKNSLDSTTCDKMPSNWLKSLKKLPEYNFDKITKEDDYICLKCEIIEVNRLCKENKDNRELMLLKKICNVFEEVGNPIKIKRFILTDIGIEKVFGIDSEEIDKQNFFSNYLELAKLLMDFDVEDREKIFEKYPEISMYFLDFLIEEMYRYIESFFDTFLISLDIKKDTFKLIKSELFRTNRKLEAITSLYMEFETPSNKPIRLIRKDSFYYKHLSLQIRRMNRDQYFSSLTYLKKYKKLLPLYALVDLMKSSEVYKEKNLAVIMGGRKDYEQKTYRDNREILDKYDKLLELRQMKHLNRGLPRPSIYLNTTDLLQSRIMYNEFINLKSENKNKRLKEKNYLNHSIPTILSSVIKSEVKRVEYDPELFKIDLNKKTLFDYYDNHNFNENINERNVIVYKQTVLLTEKIRRGIYGEFDKTKDFNAILDYLIDLKKIIVHILAIKNIDLEIDLVTQLYSAIKDFFDRCVDPIKSEFLFYKAFNNT